MQVWNVLHAAHWKYRTQKIVKNSPSGHHRITLSDYIFTTKAHIDNRKKKLVKQQYIPHMSSQYGELRPTDGWDQFVSVGHPCKFQRVSHFRFVSAATLEANQTLHDVWPSPGLVHYIYIFRGSCPITEFCEVQNSLCVQVLRSPILSALPHGTRVVGIGQTLRRWAEGATYIQQGGHHVGNWPTF